MEPRATMARQASKLGGSSAPDDSTAYTTHHGSRRLTSKLGGSSAPDDSTVVFSSYCNPACTTHHGSRRLIIAFPGSLRTMLCYHHANCQFSTNDCERSITS